MHSADAKAPPTWSYDRGKQVLISTALSPVARHFMFVLSNSHRSAVAQTTHSLPTGDSAVLMSTCFPRSYDQVGGAFASALCTHTQPPIQKPIPIKLPFNLLRFCAVVVFQMLNLGCCVIIIYHTIYVTYGRMMMRIHSAMWM